MRLFIFFFTHVLCTSIIAQDSNSNDAAKKLLKEIVSNEQSVGLSAAYSVEGAMVWQGAEGMADQDANQFFQSDTKCRIASIAKPMTAVAIMQLMEAGKIDLDNKVVQYLPDFPKDNITVRQILNHSSGIRAYKNKKENNNYNNYPTLQAAADIYLGDELLFEPGTDFNYTSYGYTVLGLLIEKISGQSYEIYMKDNVWGKVGMNNTGIEKFGVEVNNKANIYHKNNKGKTKKVKQTNLSDRIPAGGFYSTAPDLIKFGNGILDGTLIKKETMILMQENLGLKKEGNGYGLGWYLYGENPNLGNVFGHNGAQLGTSCWMMLLPDVNAVTVVISNTSGALQETFGVTMGMFGLLK